MPFDGTQVPEKALAAKQPICSPPAKARILIDALELLRRDGWCQGRIENNTGQHCILGAVYIANGVELGRDRQVVRTAEMQQRAHDCQVMMQYEGRPINRYNDAPGRTFEEVETWFEEQIARAMRGEDVPASK